jgi:signal transduction histidine kinase
MSAHRLPLSLPRNEAPAADADSEEDVAVQTPLGFARSDTSLGSFFTACSDGLWCLELPRPVPARLSPDEQVDQILRGGLVSEANDAAASMLGAADGEGLCGLGLMAIFGPEACVRAALTEFVDQDYRLADRDFALPGDRDGQRVAVTLTGVVEHGALVRVFGVQRRARDRAVSSDIVRQAQRQANVGQLSGSMAHEFNNLLTAIIGYAEMLRAGTDAASREAADVEQILTAGRRAAVLTRQLVTFTRPQARPAELFDLNAALIEFEPLLRRLVREQVDIVLDCAPEAALVDADRGHLELVLLNLVLNARDAMPAGGKVVIGTALERDGGRTRMELTVTDAGVGMSHELQARVFEPFFTTKPGALGLGLTTAQDLVAMNRGCLRVTSSPGRGSTFTVTIDGVAEGEKTSGASTVTSIAQFRSRHRGE